MMLPDTKARPDSADPRGRPDSSTALDHAACPLDGSTLIEAAAGTGKTFAITRLYLRLLLEREIPVSRILVVTFTEAATRELKERLRATLRKALAWLRQEEPSRDVDEFMRTVISRLDPDRAVLLLEEGLRSFDSAAVYTIHGFCRQVLVENAFETGTLPGSTMCTEERELADRVAADFWRRTMSGASPWFVAFLKSKGCADPSWFRKLYESKQGPQEYRLVPGSADDPPCSDQERRCAELMDRARESWAERETIATLLASPSLKKNRYSPHCVAGMLKGMDALLGLSVIDPAGAASLQKFTADSIRSGTKKNQPVPAHRFFDVCDELFASLATLHEAFEQKLLSLKIRFFEHAGRLLEAEKERQALLGFDDLLVRVHRSMLDPESGPSLRAALGKTYQAACVDEFQDTDPVQFAIFDAVFGRDLPVFYIGDPKQAIYRFRGADIFAYFTAARSARRRFSLSTNYRSDPALIDAINALFGSHPDPFAFEPVVYRPVRPGLDCGKTGFTIDGRRRAPFTLLLHGQEADVVSEVKVGGTKAEIAAAVSTEIAAILRASNEKRAFIGSAPVQPSDVAVLVRTNAEASMVHATLTAARIPAVISMSGSVFGTDEAWEFELLLAAVAEPGRVPLVKAALATPFFGLTPGEIDGLDADDRRWARLLFRFQEYRGQWNRNGILSMVRSLMHDEKLRDRLLPLEGGERKLTNFLHLAELLHADAIESHAGMAALVQRLSHRRARSGETVPPDEEMLRLDRDDAAVRIVTIHKSKGLEYPIVFCPFAWHAPRGNKEPLLFHDPGAGFQPSLALDEASIQAATPLAEDEQLAEDLRLLYVALTRAKSACYCVWSPARGSESSALSWLLFGTLVSPDALTAGSHMSALRDVVSRLTVGDAAEEIRRRFAEAASIEVTAMRAAPPARLDLDQGKKAPEPVLRIMSRPIPPPRRVLSYSSIVHALPGPALEFDEPDFRTGIGADPVASAARDFRSFPRGTRAGIFLHELFEQTDLSIVHEAETGEIGAKLARYGFQPSWAEPVRKLLQSIADLPLDPASGLALGKIPLRNCLKEMEFYFPAKPFKTLELLRCLGYESPDGESIPGLHGAGTAAGGYLKGSIDLVFEWQGRFFILDWKSNFLGDSPDDYAEKRLRTVMEREHYIVQYHLYSVALDRFLMRWKRGYSFEEHFGGVYYFFLRGIDAGGSNRAGVFFDRPSADRIRRLNALLCPAA